MPEPNGSPKDKSIASAQSKKKQCSLPIAQPELTMDQKITHLVEELANRFNLTTEEIDDWLKLNHVLPKEELWQLLQLAKRFGLNPILGQIDCERDEEGVWQLFITIDGWIALLHQQNSFVGLTFNEANESEDGIPLWMQCAIFRSDKTTPITVKEYFCEVRSNHPA
jgi:hypothetical protein